MTWRSIKDDPPPKDGRWMLVAWHNPDDDCGYCAGVVRYAGQGEWREKLGYGADDPVGMPTHWMPLPDPPDA